MARRASPTESLVRQVQKRLERWPEISFARIASEVGLSRETVKRIAKRKHRPGRNKRGARCPGCGGALRKKRPCLVCLNRRLLAQGRLALAVARSTPAHTVSTR